MGSDPITIGFIAVGVAAALYVCLLLVRRSRVRKEARSNGTAESSLGARKLSEQALLVKIKLSDSQFGEEQERASIHKLGNELEKEISAQVGIGDYDGDEFGGGLCTLFMYGPSAEKLFDVTIPILLKFQAPHGSFVIKRYGGVGAKEERIPLAASE